MKMYADAEEYLLSIVSKHIGTPGGDVPRWVQLKLSQVQSVHKDLRTAVDGLAERSLAERIKLMWAAHDEGADGLFRELGIDDARATRSQSVVTLIDDTNQRFSELHRRILRDATDTYRDVLSKALPLANMGVETTQQAIRRALNAFADRGITAVVDKAGRRWGMAEYAEMATRTGMMLSSIAGYTQEALNHSEDLVIISDHWDECPLCAQWERTVLSLTGATPGYPTVADARAGGLFHPNCLHSMTVYVPGLTDIRGGKTGNRTREQDTSGYDSRQKQRYIERTIRRWKRRQAVATTPEEERIAKAYVGKWQRAARELVGDTKLPRKYSREGGRVLLSEAAKKLKPLKVSENGGIINTKISKYGKVVNPMDSKKYTRMKERLKNRGIIVVEAVGDDFRYLRDGIKAEATYSHGYILHIGEVPSASAFFEEIIHSTQARKYGEMEEYNSIELSAREVAANRMLLKYGKSYGFDADDVADIKRNLAYWEERYRKETGYAYEAGIHNRQI